MKGETVPLYATEKNCRKRVKRLEKTCNAIVGCRREGRL